MIQQILDDYHVACTVVTPATNGLFEVKPTRSSKMLLHRSRKEELHRIRIISDNNKSAESNH
jgi:translation initiation factor IF-1